MRNWPILLNVSGRRAREEINVHPRRTHVLIQMPDFAPQRIPIAPADDPEQRTKLLERLVAATADRVGEGTVRLVLPRHQYVIKCWSLPETQPEFRDEVVRHQLDVRLTTGVEGMYWDYQLEPATDDDPKLQSVVAYAAPSQAVDDWQTLLAQAGLATSRVTVQTDEALSVVTGNADGDLLVIVDTGDSVEIICMRCGVPLACGCCEKSSASKWSEEMLREEWTRLSAVIPADYAPRRGVILEHASSELVEWVKNTFVLDELFIPNDETPRRSVGPRTLDLLRQSRLPTVAVERRRRRIRYAAAGLLLLLGIAWAVDLQLRELDDEIAQLTQEVDANARLLQAGERMAKTETYLSNAWQGRRDWTALLDAVSRPLNDEADVRLTSMHGERCRDDLGTEIRIAGAATQGAAVPRLMDSYSDADIPFSVSPLGMRPIRNAEVDGVQFEIRLTSPDADGAKRGSHTDVK